MCILTCAVFPFMEEVFFILFTFDNLIHSVSLLTLFYRLLLSRERNSNVI